MKNADELIERLRSRLSHDRMSDGEFTAAVAEILAASTDQLSDAELDKEWRDSLQRPLN
jgi:hypothetical protein